MTCVAALVHGGKVHMCADSAATGDDASQMTLLDPKCWRAGSFAIGCAGSGSWWHLLRYGVRWPRIGRTKTEELVRVKLVDALRDACEKHDVDPGSGSTLIGVHGILYVLEGELVPVRLVHDCHAIGSGAALAIGSLESGADGTPRERLARALEVAERRSATVRRPWKWAVA